MQINDLFHQPHTILLDGGMGTMLQAAGLQLGARPEELNITDPEAIQRIHGMYAAAGSRIINTNTYGASVIGLTVDGAGVPSGVEERVAIARRIRDAALAAGIPIEDIYIDCLALTASAQQEDALAAVEALERCKKELGVRTILGVSNISFGLPCRAYLNTIFLTLAIHAGLDLAIMDPASQEMMAAIYAYNVLSGRDKQCAAYVERYAGRVPTSTALARIMQSASTGGVTYGVSTNAAYAPLMKAVEQGLKGEAAAAARTLLQEKDPLELVDGALIPALDAVGA